MDGSLEQARILIVDDTPENIHILMETLKDDYLITVAINGEKALKMAAKAPIPDLILLDIMMPGLDGYEVCYRLKGDTKTENIPVIFITALSEVESKNKGFNLGAVDYITKPFEPLEVLARVRTHLELKQHRDNLEKLVMLRTMDLQKANKNLRQAKEAAEAGIIAKNSFLANMSHEIRTPLNGVIAAAELAQNEELSPKVDKYLHMIDSSAGALLGIINDILDFSKIEAGKLEMEELPFSLGDIFNRLADIFSTNVQEKKIDFAINIDPKVPLMLTGDALRLQQVLTNLLANAFKFTPAGGIIQVGVQLNDDSQDNLELQFKIKDSGIGIAPEKLQLLFEPFTQADSSTTRKFGGTGLGLTISKHLTEMMAGRLWAESESGAGSTFYFTAHFTRPDENTVARLDQEVVADLAKLKSMARGKRVLVAEDNLTNQDIILEILETAGVIVELVNNGQEAVAAVERNPFDLVLMDCQMPILDGYEASQQIHAKPHHAKLPIIALTAHALKGDREKCLAATMNDFVTKPINQQDLFQAIARFAMVNPQDRASDSTMDMAVEQILPPANNILSDMPGINSSQALQRLGINQATYSKILLRFASNQQDCLAEMNTALVEKDWSLLQRLAHTIKGTAANIGAEKLRQVAWDIERPIKEGTPELVTAELLVGMEKQLELVFSSIARLAEGPAAVNRLPEEISSKNDRDGNLILAELCEALETADSEMIRKYLALAKHIPAPTLQRIQAEVADYEYDNALHILQQIMAQQ